MERPEISDCVSSAGRELTTAEILAASDIAPEIKEFVRKQIVVRRGAEPAEVRECIDFFNEHVPVDIFREISAGNEFSNNQGRTSLLRYRLSFLKALRERTTEEQWQSLLANPAQCNYFYLAACGAAGIINSRTADFEDLIKRTELPVVAEDGEERRAAEVQDVLATTGIDKIAIGLVKEVQVQTPLDTNDAKGSYDGISGVLEVCLEGIAKPLLPKVLLHEIGHGLQYRMTRDPEGVALFDRYIVAMQLDAKPFSEYAESFSFTDGKGSIKYVEESFSEEFALYWMMPEKIPQNRRLIFDEICDRFLSVGDREKVRNQIMSVVGNYYGKPIREALQSFLDAKSIAERRKRVENEDKSNQAGLK